MTRIPRSDWLIDNWILEVVSHSTHKNTQDRLDKSGSAWPVVQLIILVVYKTSEVHDLLSVVQTKIKRSTWKFMRKYLTFIFKET